MANDNKSKLPYEDDARVWPDASYLRQQARRCVSLSRECPHEVTARALEKLGVDLLEKAVETGIAARTTETVATATELGLPPVEPPRAGVATSE
jgi:hypothetical protein